MKSVVKHPPTPQAILKSVDHTVQQINKRLAVNSFYKSTAEILLQAADMLTNAANRIYRACSKENCSAAFTSEITNEWLTAIEAAIKEIPNQRAEPAPETACEESVGSDIIITKSVYPQNNIPVDEPIDIHEEIAETSMEEIFGNRRIL